MAVTIEVRVIPSSGRAGFFLDTAGRLKCHLKSVPEKGKANKELIGLLAKVLGVPKQDIEIVGGLISRTKRLRISATLTQEQVMVRLGIERQGNCV
ncbi:hypothetical protein CVU75_02800 [Candidatus Dependentiae bacterium HGW-Dependentiae-1]|nr:MAG: hypothetical protein CVU75_02800 [Candidatus Dependentiae bacterium HGW-Dependentiae-1]